MEYTNTTSLPELSHPVGVGQRNGELESEQANQQTVQRSGDERQDAGPDQFEFEISDLLDFAHWREGLDRFAEATNLAVAVMDTAGEIVGSVINPRPMWSVVRERFPIRANACPFCLSPVRGRACTWPPMGNQRISDAVDANGMAHVIVPLMFEGRSIGTLLAGQCFSQYADAKMVDRLAQEFHIFPARLWRVARLEYPVSRTTLKIYGRLLVTIGQTILQTRVDALGQSARLREVSDLSDALAQEVIQRTKAQMELAKERDSLEVTVAERTIELQKSHERTRLSERLAAIGTLAAGLGHDMGNLLLPMKARLDSIDERNKSRETHDDIKAIRECAQYLQRLTRGLRTFAMETSPEGTTELNLWRAEIEQFFRNAVPRHIELHWELPADIGHVAIDASSLTQVVFNLVQNAGDVMKEQRRGRIVVWSRPGPTLNEIQIGVTDSGPGMSEEIKQRCLEPFFTTKTRTLSTGLGLAIVHGIVQKVHGKLEVESQSGIGSTFIVTLQRAATSHDSASVKKFAAIISVRDPRRRALVSAVLNSEDCPVVLSDGLSDEDDALLVCDMEEGEMEANEFFASNPDGHVMALSNTPPQRSTDQRISMIEGTPSAIRRELRRLRTEPEYRSFDSDG